MNHSFESEKNKKAFIYTAIICGTLLLLFILIKWKNTPASIPMIQELIEVNLGNNDEGMGEDQPLSKGTPTQVQEKQQQNESSSTNQPTEKNISDESISKEEAAVLKTEKNNKKNTPTNTEKANNKTNTKPILTYKGPGKGKNGNNTTEDNGYKYQGNKENGKGDAGDPKGNKDSYGNNPGGAVGGPKVTKGTRKITKYYTFSGELNKATIYAIIKVSPAGQGKFIGFDKGSTSHNKEYAQAISSYLNNMQFNTTEEESTVTVQFNFSIN